MSNEEPTTTFGKLAIGAKYRAPWTYEVKEKISHTQARGLATGAIYNCHPNKPVCQDWYIEQEAERLESCS